MGKALAISKHILARENDRLRRCNSRQADLMRSISHDFNNLISVIRGYGRLAQNASDPTTVAEYLDRMLGTTSCLQSVAEALHLDPTGDEPLSLGACIREAAWAVLLERHELRLPADGPWVRADRASVVRVIANLLGNAAKFAPAGTAIEVRAEVVGDKVHCTVLDEGPGIPEHERDDVFGTYYRGSHAVPGCGLGLSIVKRLVELQGGRVWVDAAPGGGCAVHFTLAASLGTPSPNPDSSR